MFFIILISIYILPNCISLYANIKKREIKFAEVLLFPVKHIFPFFFVYSLLNLESLSSEDINYSNISFIFLI